MGETLDFATAESTRQRDGESCIAWANRTFCPCFPGVHLCGADHEENRFFTILNARTRTTEEARALWEAIKAECEVDEEAGDFVVDYNTENSHEDDFWSSRQMLPRIAQVIAKALGDPVDAAKGEA